MKQEKYVILDANEAVADVAYRLNEIISIYPITPSSPMAEWADTWSARKRENLWGTVPEVVEMQSEGGAAGALHGALQTGALSTTFTASQGLLLMLPNLLKIVGELTPTVLHIAARTVATHALSIFGDHSDVMAARFTGCSMLAAASVQEAADMAVIAHVFSLESRIPVLHFFDGFRTSHEVNKIHTVNDDSLRQLISAEKIKEHRQRGLTPEHPVLRGTAQNPDVFFQAREAANMYYENAPEIAQQVMAKFAELTGRDYRIFEYYGHAEAERVIVIMGSAAVTVQETVKLLLEQDEKVGVVLVRLYRPFAVKRFVAALPSTVKKIAVLDRTKESGSSGEPLYLDCVAALHEAGKTFFETEVVGGRYGLSSKEFTPAMVKAVFENLTAEIPKKHFTIGIHDDISGSSLDFDPEFSIESAAVFRAVFYGLGSDGTVGANKNTIKIIGEKTNNFVQGYFVYDSKKSGSITISHLRFGKQQIRAPYLIEKSNYVGCHQAAFLEQRDVLETIISGGTFLLNTHYDVEKVWHSLPRITQEQLIRKKLSFYVIDAEKISKQAGMGRRINTIMQVCFFATCGILPREEAIEAIKDSIHKTYGNKGHSVVDKNIKAVEMTLAHLHEISVPEKVTSCLERRNAVPEGAPDFVRNVLGRIIAGKGESLPVSALPADGTFPTNTARWEKRNISSEVPVWDPEVCIQCGKCSMVCPHGVIRAKVYDEYFLQKSPENFLSTEVREKSWKGKKYTLQISLEDCTGCGICVDVCPAKNKSVTRLKAINMRPSLSLREQEVENWNFFLSLPEMDRREIDADKIPQQQLQQPLFEFSGACSGCGETPYIKLATQLFGDRMVVANATGCSSIYGANLPTTPYSQNSEGRGPAWSNSLFEDNAEFGLGFRISLDQKKIMAEKLLAQLTQKVGEKIVSAIMKVDQSNEAGIYEQRQNVEILKETLRKINEAETDKLLELADNLLRKSVWIIGGDGWAYDIGFGGLDHVLASGRNVNILVLDTEVYSNTGGQTSKATPTGAVAKFSAGGKESPKKDLGLIAMSYANVYVASVAMGANDTHTLRTFIEAEAYDGPSLIIAYSHCIAHGINMTTAMQNQKKLVNSGQWQLYSYHPDRFAEGINPLRMVSKPAQQSLEEYFHLENRFKMLQKSDPETAKRLVRKSEKVLKERRAFYEHLASRNFTDMKQDN
ncbi:MAG: pyruvate:ferredoxin (flavodoxin) oxidoreductase [Deltaproteobacteria bacterium]|nr:pyruvate:ferredoxin (flavodoxin) oxidoreductase [Deltaproteobacteria bacterium]